MTMKLEIKGYETLQAAAKRVGWSSYGLEHAAKRDDVLLRVGRDGRTSSYRFVPAGYDPGEKVLVGRHAPKVVKTAAKDPLEARIVAAVRAVLKKGGF